MPLRYQKFITRQDLRDNPNTLYVFGDNLEGWGMGGQAAEMRGEPNAVGIPTKVSPSVYFEEKNINSFYDKFLSILDKKTDLLMEHLAAGKDVVWPEDGIGTGLARLEEKCPTVWRTLKHIKHAIEEVGKKYS